MSTDENAALKPHFEAILGRELDIGEEITIRSDVGTFNTLEGNVTSRNIGTTGAFSKGCEHGLMLDVTGLARTGPDGEVSFLLTDFHCLKALNLDRPLNFVATPLDPGPISVGPVFLTVRRGIIPGEDEDVRITVKSWGPTGTPVGNIAFDWRCRVLFTRIPTVP
jgi:hypothetical protein